MPNHFPFQLFNNFGHGGVTLSSPDGATVGSTVDGVTITGRVIVGADHPQILLGTSHSDDITGGDGRDVIIGGRGDDVLTGGADSPTGADRGDLFLFGPGSGQDVITDFHGADRIDIAAYLRQGDHVSVSDGAEGAVIDLGTGDSITLLGVSSSQLVQTQYGFEISQILVG